MSSFIALGYLGVAYKFLVVVGGLNTNYLMKPTCAGSWVFTILKMDNTTSLPPSIW